MIYLIDDNKYKQMSLNYQTNFEVEIKKYSSYIEWKNNILKEDIDNIIQNAECILIHDSYNPLDIKNEIVEKAKEANIHYVLFSNSYSSTITENTNITKIKKDLFYKNLLPFIDDVIANSEINLDILSYGKEYNQKKIKILENSLLYNTLYFQKNNLYSDIFISSSKETEELSILISLLKQFDSSFDDFDDFDKKCSDNNYSGEEIIDIIKELIRKVNI